MIARLLETSPRRGRGSCLRRRGRGGRPGRGRHAGGHHQRGDEPPACHRHRTGRRAPRQPGQPLERWHTIASGNLLADMRFNVTAESQGRLQVARLYQLTGDSGVRDMFSFLLARDTMHQNQWLAAIEELEKDGLEETPVPSNFPQELEMGEVAYRYMNFSEGHESQQGRWAGGPSKDGKGQFEYVAEPQAMGEMVEELNAVDPRLYGTPKQPTQPSSS